MTDRRNENAGTTMTDGSDPTAPSRSSRHRVARGLLAGLFVVALAATAIGTRTEPADAFGTVDSKVLNQKAVHERITRVLACTSTQAPDRCFDAMSISALAGQNGSFGAVGEPDNPLDGFPNPAARHCDDGDHGYGSSHSESDAWSEVSECLAYYQQYLQFAVDSAGRLLDANRAIDPAQTEVTNLTGSAIGCSLPDPVKGHTSEDSAKCNVLNGLGRALHLYEDFWSHSNWGDLADPAQQVGLTNPDGLDVPEQPDFFAFPGPVATSFPEGLITGCDDSLSKSRCTGRTGHSVVNKDNGDVDPNTCVATAPLTSRGKVDADGALNFQRAVSGACGAALRAWSDLRAALVATYGDEPASLMVHAITSDHPLTECSLSGKAAKALDPPVGNVSSARSVDVTLVNDTSASLTCGEGILDGGEWSNYPADHIAPGATVSWRTQSNGLATGTEGTAKLLVDGTGTVVTVYWNNPYIGSNSARCTVDAPFRCSATPLKGNNAALTVTLTRG